MVPAEVEDSDDDDLAGAAVPDRTAAQCHLGPAPAARRAGHPGRAAVTALAASVRLTRLHLASRRTPESVLIMAVMAAALRIMLHWTPADGVYSVMVPLIVATAAAAVVSVTTRSPLGEPERATGRWL